MARLAPITPPTAKPLTPTFSRNTNYSISPRFHRVLACTNGSDQEKHVQRRSLGLGLAGVALVLGLSVSGGSARAAARRPPPPPAEEKKDPNVSGVMAKVLASNKRKEAMKESIAKLREKGKVIDQEPSQ